MKILLASESPRRKFLLTSLGYQLECMAPSIDEHEGGMGRTPEHIAILNALEKARAILKKQPDVDWDIVIAADTVVVIDGEILNKPTTKDKAQAMLERLSGRSHEVITGFCLINRAHEEYSQAVHSLVKFRALSQPEKEAYLASEEGFDKAGGYAIQGMGAALVDRIDGSLTNIIGLPVEEVLYHAKRLYK